MVDMGQMKKFVVTIPKKPRYGFQTATELFYDSVFLRQFSQYRHRLW